MKLNNTPITKGQIPYKSGKRNEIKRHIIQIAPSFTSQKKGEWRMSQSHHERKEGRAMSGYTHKKPALSGAVREMHSKQR